MYIYVSCVYMYICISCYDLFGFRATVNVCYIVKPECWSAKNMGIARLASCCLNIDITFLVCFVLLCFYVLWRYGCANFSYVLLSLCFAIFANL